MISIGIHDGHNSAACLMKDGKILAAIQEERIRYHKNYPGFPIEAIKWVLTYSNILIDEIDCFAFNGEHMPILETRRESLLEKYKYASSMKVKAKRLRVRKKK